MKILIKTPRNTSLALTLGLTLGLGALFLQAAASAADKDATDWQRWAKHNPDSNTQIDYSAWKTFTDEFGAGQGETGALDYLWVKNRGVGDMNDLIYALQEVPVSKLSRDQQLAYWLNLHNLESVRQSSYDYSFKDDSTREFIVGEEWQEKTLTVEGNKLSLNEIEQNILFKQWPDARVVYGVYLPANSSPKLRHEPFSGDSVWQKLEARARTYVNSGKAIQFRDGDLHVSALYQWDGHSFVDAEGTLKDELLIAHLKKYAQPELRKNLDKHNTIRASYFNWRLNTFNSGYDINQDRTGFGS